MPSKQCVCLTCRSSHLTNDAVQEKFDHYGTFEDSNKLSMEAFQELFADQVVVLHSSLASRCLSLKVSPETSSPRDACIFSTGGYIKSVITLVCMPLWLLQLPISAAIALCAHLAMSVCARPVHQYSCGPAVDR